jgi:hypothetical protein
MPVNQCGMRPASLALQLAGCERTRPGYDGGMKLLWAIVVYLVIGLILGWGILLAVKGSPWLLIVSFVAYVVAFAKIGCLPKKSH